MRTRIMTARGLAGLMTLFALGDAAAAPPAEAGVEVFWTHRSNDIHDSFTDAVLCNWKRENPLYMMGTPEDIQRYEVTHPRHMWSTLDLENHEVLDYLYRIAEEV